MNFLCRADAPFDLAHGCQWIFPSDVTDEVSRSLGAIKFILIPSWSGSNEERYAAIPLLPLVLYGNEGNRVVVKIIIWELGMGYRKVLV